MNENVAVIALRRLMDDDVGWGREAGRVVYQRLLAAVEDNPGIAIFRVSLGGIRRMDISFASETVVEIAKRFRGSKGFCLVDVPDPDLLENLEAAAARKGQPLMVWTGETPRVIGVQPNEGSRAALAFALDRPLARASEFSQANPGMSITNASTKFKQLSDQGFLLRRDAVAESGGVEFVYFRVK